MGDTSIQWTDKTWSPIRSRVRTDAAAIARRLKYSSLIEIGEKMAGRVGPHCEVVSDGCKNCYSRVNNARCLPANGTGLPFDRRSRELVETFVDEHILRNPLDWKKPLKVFVENQSDLFGEWVTDEQIDHVFAVMALCPQHTFQVLTKRPERMLRWFHHARVESPGIRERVWSVAQMMPGYDPEHPKFIRTGANAFATWPLPNVWLGVSVEDQETADARIPLLLQTPAAKRFVSYEPALGPVDFSKWALATASRYFLAECRRCHSIRSSEFFHVDGSEDSDIYCRDCPVATGDPIDGLDRIIVGGESGPGARPSMSSGRGIRSSSAKLPVSRAS
jgi:protein gp37